MMPNSQLIFAGHNTANSAKQQIQLERKEDMKARGLASPDSGDVLAMTFAVKVAARRKPAAQNLVYSFPEIGQRWMG